jgi:tetratricopeptide (TPR) repeat protein
MRELARLLLLSAALLAACSWHHARTSSAGVAACDPAAQGAFDAGQLVRARQGFAAGLAAATRAWDRDRQEVCTFYLGLVAQTEARQQTDPRQRRQLLAEAVRWYQTARPKASRAPGRAANLARVYADLGDPARADALFDAALARARGDTRAALARSYARLLEPRNWVRSVELYRQVLARAPTDDDSREALFSLLVGNAPQELPNAVWDAVDSGRVLQAQQAALHGLTRSETSGPARTELLAGLVAALSQQHYDSAGFAASEVGLALRRLETDPQVAAGARQVLLAHSANKPKARDFKWWNTSGTPYRRSPLFAFRSLLRSLALRADQGDPRLAKQYLTAAADLGAETPDTQLWIEVAGNQLATGDFDTFDESVERWDRLLQRSTATIGREDLAVYRQTMGEVRERVETLRAQAASVRRRHGLYLADGGCIYGPGSCSDDVMLRIPVSSLPIPGKRAVSGLSEQTLIEVGCRGRRVEQLLSQWPSVPGSVTVRLVPYAFQISFPRGRRPDPQQPTQQGWQRVALDTQPAWLSSAAWTRGSDLYLADSLRRQLLRIDAQGNLKEAVPALMPDGDDGYLHVQRSPAGEVVAEQASGELELGVGSGSSGTLQLLGRGTAKGEVGSVLQWTPLENRGILAVADLVGKDGIWRNAIIQLDAAGQQVEIVHWIGRHGRDSDLYRVGIPALAAIGAVGYFLALEEDPIGLYELRRGGLPHRLSTLPPIPGGLRDQLHRQMTLDRTADLFRLLAAGSIPAGIFGQGDALFLLDRHAEKTTGRISWNLVRLDPRNCRRFYATSIPTTAPHLTAAPGDRLWAFFEKQVVEGFGRQAVPSMLLVSSELLRATSPGVSAPMAKIGRPFGAERTR